MGELSDIGTIKKLIEKTGFSFRRDMGQNFLINPSVCPKMAQNALENAQGVIEIGAGIGVLTKELAGRAEKVVSFELDEKLIPLLNETLSEFDNVEIINADFLKCDIRRIIDEKFGSMRICVCANLPYYITSPVIMSLLESRIAYDNITVMVQKEAADRLCAEPGTRQAGAITAAVSYYSVPQKLFNVSKGSFMPAPKVDSTVIRLKIREKAPVELTDEGFFFSVIKAAFSQRRKTAVNSLSSGLGISKEKISEALTNADLSPTARAEELTLNNFAEISNYLYKNQIG